MPAAIAPLMAGWNRLTGGQPGPLASASGEAPNGLLVEILVDGSWLDITSRVMVRDNSGSIGGSRGQTAEGQAPVPAAWMLQLTNRDGYFSTGNPVSPLWGKTGRNTQIRVSVPNGEVRCYRLWGVVPAWPEDWDTTGKDVWVDVAAAGILRQQNQGVSALDSALRRAIPTDETLLAYWPMEDAAGSTQAASPLPGVRAMATTGLTFGSDSTLPASSPLPSVGATASISASVPTYTGAGQWRIEVMYRIDTALTTNLDLFTVNLRGGTAAQWICGFFAAGGGAYVHEVTSSSVFTASIPGLPIFTGQWLRITLEVQESGGTVTARFAQNLDADDGEGGYSEYTAASTAAGTVSSITSGFDPEIEGASVGHLAVYSTANRTRTTTNQPEVFAYTGESVEARMTRLCTEEGMAFTETGPADAEMGPQRPLRFLDLLQECVDVDQGILMEDSTALGLAYIARANLCNQEAALTLSYPDGQLAAVPVPVPDDANLRNIVTASRPSGSSASAVQETGALSILPPPRGVGPYPDTPTLNVAADADLYQHAAWRVHLGTVDEPRYPAVSVNLASPAMASLRADALRVLPGSRIVITGPPGRLGGDISQLVVGIQETITAFEHRITFVCEPESPYRIATLNDDLLGRLGTAGAVLAGDMTPTSATVLVTTTTGPLWDTTSTSAPFDITVSGEQMTVTSITGAASPQTFAVTRSVNGVVKTHQAQEPVSLTQPMILGL